MYFKKKQLFLSRLAAWVMTLSLVLSCALVACDGGSSSDGTNGDGSNGGNDVPVSCKWLVMYYVDADNNLEEYLMRDLNEMESVDVSSKDVKVIALVDRPEPHYWIGDGNWSDTRAFEVGFDSNGYNETLSATTRRLSIPGLGISPTSSIELNMGAQETLEKFVSFCVSNYEAEHYMLLFTNHGGGWRDDEEREKERQQRMLVEKAICWDETDNNDSLYMSEVRQAIEKAMQGSKLDIVAMDACLMGMVEVAYELKDVAKILVASSASIPGLGYPYTQIFTEVVNTSGDLLPENFARILVDKYYTVYTEGGSVEYPFYTEESITLSAIDLSKIEAVATAIDNLGSAMMSGGYTDVANRLCSESFDYVEYVDIYDFCSLETGYDPYRAAVKDAIDDAVLVHKAGEAYRDSHGLALYFPYGGIADSEYSADNIQFAAAASHWVEFINTLEPTAVDALEIVQAENSPFAGNDDPNAALYNTSEGTMLTDAVPLNSLISREDDADWFLINDNNGNFTVDLLVPADHDYDLVIYGVTDDLFIRKLVSSDSDVGVNESVTISSDSTYIFYFALVSGSNSFSITDYYQLTYTDH